MGDRSSNRSYETDGTDDPNKKWLNRHVRLHKYPDWGLGRVMRWYPAANGKSAKLRVMCEGRSPVVVSSAEVDWVQSAEPSPTSE